MHSMLRLRTYAFIAAAAYLNDIRAFRQSGSVKIYALSMTEQKFSLEVKRNERNIV